MGAVGLGGKKGVTGDDGDDDGVGKVAVGDMDARGGGEEDEEDGGGEDQRRE